MNRSNILFNSIIILKIKQGSLFLKGNKGKVLQPQHCGHFGVDDSLLLGATLSIL